MVDSNVSASVGSLKILSSVFIRSLAVAWKVAYGHNLQHQLLFQRGLLRLNCQGVLGADDVQFGRLGRMKLWLSPTVGTPLVVQGRSGKAGFWKIGISAAADLNNIVVFVLGTNMI